MRLFDYIGSLDEKELDDYAKRCDTTVNYLAGHIKHARRIPNKELFTKLATESKGNVTKHEVFEHFYKETAA